MKMRGPIAALAAATFLLCGPAKLAADFPDCNQNDIDDVAETATTFIEVPLAADAYPGQLVDIDGDGDLDLLSGDPLSWQENLDGSGTFGTVQSIASVEGDVVPADLDADGDPDLVVRIERTTDCESIPAMIQIYKNLGAGTFGPASTILQLYRCGGWCPDFGQHLEVGDRDTDGDLDIATFVIHCSVSAVYTLWNDGTGDSWESTDSLLTGSRPEIVDVNGDAVNDLLIADYYYDYAKILWLEGPDDATWHDSWCAHGPRAMYVTDLDGDGDPDIVADRDRFGEDDDLAVHTNVSGLGNFFETQLIAFTGTTGTTRITGGDLDGDGDNDLLWRRSWSSDTPVQWHANVQGSFDVPQPIGTSPGSYPTNIDTGDIDGDGDVDVLVSYVGAWAAWFRNEGNDCNGNRMPDECETDCNTNGIADACDIRGGTSVDCDGNGTPDECDDECVGTCDSDGDGCRDSVDSSPDDPNACGDSDGDGCDDCAGGFFDPADDGTNGDSDGACDLTDCDPLNNEVWTDPGPATGLSLAPNGAATALAWSRPVAAGGIAVRYDVLRSTSASDFLSGATTLCLESDEDDTSAGDTETPESGEVFHYLVRVENDCTGDGGSMGTGPNEIPRVGLPCVTEPSGDGLVLNEVDYNQPGADTQEFVEVFNSSSAPVDLTNLALIFVGRWHTEDTRVSLSSAGVLAPGGYLVVASPSTVVDPGASRIVFSSESDNIENAKGAIALFDLGTNTLVDALSYQDSVTAATFDGIPGTWDLVEGSPSLWTDSESSVGAMVRFPNGTDTDDASSDWRVAGPPTGLPTPGSQNTTAW